VIPFPFRKKRASKCVFSEVAEVFETQKKELFVRQPPERTACPKRLYVAMCVIYVTYTMYHQAVVELILQVVVVLLVTVLGPFIILHLNKTASQMCAYVTPRVAPFLEMQMLLWGFFPGLFFSGAAFHI
jgi:hypothetical protein